MSVNPKSVRASIETHKSFVPLMVEGKDLKVGMQILKWKGGRYVADIKLVKYFLTSSRVPTASFQTEHGTLVLFSNCAKVAVAA